MTPRIKDLRDRDDGKIRIWKDERAEKQFGKPWMATGNSMRAYRVYLTWREAMQEAIAEVDKSKLWYHEGSVRIS